MEYASRRYLENIWNMQQRYISDHAEEHQHPKCCHQTNNVSGMSQLNQQANSFCQVWRFKICFGLKILQTSFDKDISLTFSDTPSVVTSPTG